MERGGGGSSQEDKQRRSVAHLQELYTVVVAIALGLAVDRLIPQSGQELRLEPFLLAFVLLATLVPYYHGALRHLDEQYGSGAGRARGFAVLVDFPLLFLESCAFLALAVSIDRPATFAWLFVALLGLDIGWILLTTTLLAESGDFFAHRAWLAINFVAGGVVVLFLLLCSDQDVLRYALLGIALLRTALDYAVTWRFYAAAPDK